MQYSNRQLGQVFRHVREHVDAISDSEYERSRAADARIPGSGDPTPVPAELFTKLRQLDESLGYTVWFTDGEPREGASGTTDPEDRLMAIARPGNGLSRASVFRTFVHETSHAVSDRNGMPDILGLDFMSGDNYLEETVAETVAAMVTDVLKVSDLQFSSYYLKDREQYLSLYYVREYAYPIAREILAALT